MSRKSGNRFSDQGHAQRKPERIPILIGMRARRRGPMTKRGLGLSGGSGIYDLPGLEKVRQKNIKSPWGEPSAPLRIGEIGSTPVVFLSRHGKGHRLPPSDINYRANIDVLKRAGVTDVV